MGFITLEKGIEKWDILESSVYPKPEEVVSASVSVEGNTVVLEFNEELESNSCYLVVVSPDVRATDGTQAELQVYYFTTKYSPLYCSYQEVLSEVTPIAPEFTPRMVYEAIRNASLYVSELTEVKEDSLSFGVKQFVKYKAAYSLVSKFVLHKNIHAGETQQLDDLRVQYREVNLDVLCAHLEREMRRWQRSLEAKPRWVVKGGGVTPNPIASRRL